MASRLHLPSGEAPHRGGGRLRPAGPRRPWRTAEGARSRRSTGSGRTIAVMPGCLVHGGIASAMRVARGELAIVGRPDPPASSARHRRLLAARSAPGDPPAGGPRGRRCRRARGSARARASRRRSLVLRGSARRAAASRPDRLRSARARRSRCPCRSRRWLRGAPGRLGGRPRPRGRSRASRASRAQRGVTWRGTTVPSGPARCAAMATAMRDASDPSKPTTMRGASVVRAGACSFCGVAMDIRSCSLLVDVR